MNLPPEIALPEDPQIAFEGFGPEAFALLESLRQHPHIEQYRKIKPELERYVTAPFKQYRDDLAVNYVIPNGLPLETERNVFSRLLKNDFGAGGCHHHLWLSFYRQGRARLKDLQMPHSLSPEGLEIGVYAGAHAPEVLDHARSALVRDETRVLALLNPLLEEGAWRFNYYLGAGKHEEKHSMSRPVAAFPAEVARASGLWCYTVFSPEEVTLWRGGLVRRALHAVQAVWPLYVHLL